MFKILKRPLLIISFIFCLITSSLTVFGAEPIYVKINNELVDYTDAKPQIMNQRAMVPIRVTAELLGATIEWNKDTETMTLIKGDRTVVHTMRSKVITVNGKAITFDTPSSVVSDRMMMPVRMLGESLGNKVDWDNSTRTVHITQLESSIISVSPDKTKVNSGETLNITIVASGNTEKIKVVDVYENDKIIAEANTYIENANGTKTFSIPWTPTVNKDTLKMIKVVPGNNMGYSESSESYKTFGIGIDADTTPKVISFDADKEKINRNDEVKITITANSNTDSIKIYEKSENNNEKELVEIRNYKIENVDNPVVRVFEHTLKMENRGEIELLAYAVDNDTTSKEYKSVTINVEGVGSVVDKEDVTFDIKDVYVLNGNVYVGEEAKIIIKTTPDIKKIEILDDKDNVIEYTRYATNKEKTHYIWDLNIPITKESRNRFYVKAYNDNDDTTTYNFDVSASNYSNNDVSILGIMQEDIGVISGDNVRFEITTTSRIDEIKILDGTDEILSTKDYSSSSSSKRKWDIKIKVDNDNRNSLKVVAIDNMKDSEGVETKEQDTKKINVYLGSIPKGEIKEFNLHTSEVYLNDTIKVDVYTNNSIEKVWIEDNNNVSMVRKVKNDGKSGNEYTWNLSFPAEETGNNVRYTIFAEDDNGNIYEDIFRVRVKK